MAKAVAVGVLSPLLLCVCSALPDRNCTYEKKGGKGVKWTGYFKPVIELDSNCTSVELSGWGFSFGNAGAKALADTVPKAAGLKTVRLKNNKIREDGMDTLLKALADTDKLEDLDLEGNGISATGLEALAATLEKQKLLQTLDLSATGLNETGFEVVAKALTQKPSKLRVLSLKDNRLGDGALQALAAALTTNFVLQELRLGGNANISSAGLQSLMPLLRHSPRLQKLELASPGAAMKAAKDRVFGRSNTTFSLSVVKSLAGTLNAFNALQELDLDRRGITDAGIEALASTFSTSKLSRLTSLSFAHNDVTDEGAKALGKALVNLKRLRRLDLSQNKLGEPGVSSVLASLAGLPELEELQLRSSGEAVGEQALRTFDVSLGKEGTGAALKQLSLKVDFTKKGVAEMFAKVIRRLPALTKLTLQGSPIDAPSAHALSIAVSGSKSLATLSLSGCTLETPAWSTFAAMDSSIKVTGIPDKVSKDLGRLAKSRLVDGVRSHCQKQMAKSEVRRLLPAVLLGLGLKDASSIRDVDANTMKKSLQDMGLPTAVRVDLETCLQQAIAASAGSEL